MDVESKQTETKSLKNDDNNETVIDAVQKSVDDDNKSDNKMKTIIVASIICFIIGCTVSGIIGWIIGIKHEKSNQITNQSNQSNQSNQATNFNVTFHALSGKQKKKKKRKKNNSNQTRSDSTCSGSNEWDMFSTPKYNYFTDSLDPSLYGQWITVIPDEPSPSYGQLLGIQMVHGALLPSGKILIVSGSSNRNGSPKKRSELYPYTEIPESGAGLYNWKDINTLLANSNKDRYYQSVNNNAIYDIDNNKFNRIPHPLQQTNPKNASQFLSNDLFCTGQLHVRDGNVLFVGGTEYFLEWFTGPKSMYIFNWTQEAEINWNYFDWTKQPENNSIYYPWSFVGDMDEGRWYPHSVPLLDGRLVIFSGTTDWEHIEYNTQVNKRVGFFNYDEFLNNGGFGGYISIDASKQENSPFMTPLGYFPPSPVATEWCKEDITTINGTACSELKNDSFLLYPQNYLMPDGRIFITQEGGTVWVIDGGSARQTNFTYFMSINGNKTHPKISWERGQNHPENVSLYGTSVQDPNNPTKINSYGGLRVHTSGVMLPGIISNEKGDKFDYKLKTQAVGNRATRRYGVFTMPDNINDIGTFDAVDDHYLGPNLDYDRTMHFATLLPTKQILINGGGNYFSYGSVKSPLLLTPIYNSSGIFTGKYNRSFLAPARVPRYYHSIALLLPDGRVLTAGGNPQRAILDWDAPQSLELNTNASQTGMQAKPNLDRANRFVYKQTDERMASGYSDCEAEVWNMEIFSPPYLFIDGDRRVIMESLEWQSPSNNVRPNVVFQGKTYYLLHSEEHYKLTLSNLPLDDVCRLSESSLVLIKLGSTTHGWDAGQKLFSLQFVVISNTMIQFEMLTPENLTIAPAYYMLFFVDCMGKPSKSLMIRFDNDATSPL